MEGDLSLLSIPDLLQMMCLGRFNRNIHLFDGPILVGVIAIREGRIEQCIGLGSRGEAAFYKLVGLRRGRYKVHPATDLATAGAELNASSWQMLLLEAARRHDEAQHHARSGPAVAMTFDVPTRQTTGSPTTLSEFDRIL